ncbi:unnamed protein product, partial [Ectocarpus sp. 12 AP-2014]
AWVAAWYPFPWAPRGVRKSRPWALPHSAFSTFELRLPRNFLTTLPSWPLATHPHFLFGQGWAFLGQDIASDVVLQGTSTEDDLVLDALIGQVLALQEAALFSWSLHIIFLLTTLAGLYRWIFQMLTFHKRMSIVTDTLSRASTHLDHFLFVFFLV